MLLAVLLLTTLRLLVPGTSFGDAVVAAICAPGP